MTPTDNPQQQHEIQIHLPGLIKILGETLYSEPEVAVREMIQNAHDSCLRRMAEDQGFRAPRIDIDVKTYERSLTFRDNGSGMTEDEIHDFLSTVGKGYTAELREALSAKNREIAEKLIGQFGLGLLSAFIIAEKIVIRTRSYRPDSRSYRWECDGNVQYTLAEADKKDVGSEVTITVSPKYTETILDENVLGTVIKTYADFLSIPIHLNRAQLRVNVVEAPWHRGAASAEYADYVRARYEEIPPLEVIPLEHEEDDLSVHGVLYIPRHTMVEIKTYGDVDVYIARMFICSGDRELLPVWAKFVRGIVDSPSLTPTLSREAIRKDEKYQRVREVLSQAILDHLDRLAEKDPKQLREVVTSHNTLIKAWALEDDGFFDKICDLAMFDTEYGKMNIPDYLKRFGAVGLAGMAKPDGEEAQDDSRGKTVYYFSEVGSGTQQMILFREAGLCVIDASYGAEQAFLQKYDERHEDVEVKKLDAGAGFIFEPIKPEDDKDGQWAALEEEFMARKMPARVAHFRPSDIPAVLLRVDEDEAQEKAVRALSEEEDLNPELRKFFKQLLQERQRYRADSVTRGGVLHLNASNAIIQQFAASQRGDPVRELAINVLYNNAVLFESHSVTPENAQVMFQGNNRAIEQLMATHQKVQELETEFTRKKLEQVETLDEQRKFADKQAEKAKAAEARVREADDTIAEINARLQDLQMDREKQAQDSARRIQEMEEAGADARASSEKLAEELALLRKKAGSMAEVLDSLDTRPNDVFVMRPFAKKTRWIYDQCIKPACDRQSLTPVHLEDTVAAGCVSDEIICHIRECGVLVADVTGGNANVMYEVGAAHILGKQKQTILLAENTDALPFDIRGFRVLSYGDDESKAGLAAKIEEALEAIVGGARRRGTV